jgi:hypothetical protein
MCSIEVQKQTKKASLGSKNPAQERGKEIAQGADEQRRW